MTLLLVWMLACTTPESNSFCVKQCEGIDGLMVSSEVNPDGDYYCTCVFRKVK